MSHERQKLTFTNSKLDVVEHLRLALGRLSGLAQMFDTSKHPEYTPDWRKRHHIIQIGPVEDTPEDRGRFQRQIIGCALTYGLDLKTSGEPGIEELAPALASWGLGALRHIQAQEDELGRVRGQLEEEQKRAAGLDGLLSKAHEIIAERDEQIERARASRDTAERDRDHFKERTYREIADLRVELEHAQALTKAAESARDAWQASATSSQDALALLKAALRIPSGPVEAPDVAGGDSVALVRR